MLTRKDVSEEPLVGCINEKDAAPAKIQNIIRSSTLCEWVDELPVIPDLLLTLLGFDDLERFVTKDFAWECWSKSFVEEHLSYPDVADIGEQAEIEKHFNRFGEAGLKLLINSIKELRAAYERCRR